MGVPNSEVGYTAAMSRREDHEVPKGMGWHWGNISSEFHTKIQRKNEVGTWGKGIREDTVRYDHLQENG